MKRVAILLSVLMTLAPCVRAQGQTSVASGQDASKKRTTTTTQTQSVSDQPKQASVKLEEGDRITLRNRFGPIIVTGVGGDTLEATATEIRKGTGEYKFHLVSSRSGRDRIMVTTAVMTPRQALSEKESKT
ncbi:MAG: hypothetical protein LC731_03870, partial [Acidobacteria bacterium]|nr:hypothetical protein [Acidobacteriota bacterium]